MRQQTISIAEAKARFSEVINRVVYGQQEIVITKRGKPVAVISAPSGKGLASVKGWLGEKDEYLEDMRKIELKRHSKRLRGSHLSQDR